MNLENKKEVWENEFINPDSNLHSYNLMFCMKAFNNEFDPESKN